MSVVPSPLPDEHVDLAEFDRMYWLLRGARARAANAPPGSAASAAAWATVQSTLSDLLALFPGGDR
jgi:hypothetical protein